MVDLNFSVFVVVYKVHKCILNKKEVYIQAVSHI